MPSWEQINMLHMFYKPQGPEALRYNTSPSFGTSNALACFQQELKTQAQEGRPRA